MKIFFTIVLLAAPVLARAYTDSDAYVSDCTKSQGLSYCQERAKTLNGGDSNTMKGLNDFVKMLNEPKRVYPEPKVYTKAQMAEIEAKLADYKHRREAEQDRQDSLVDRMRPALEEDAEELAFRDCDEPDALDERWRKMAKEKDFTEPLHLLRRAEYAHMWKINKTPGLICRDLYVGAPEWVDNWKDNVIKPLRKVISLDSPESGRTYALDAHFYLGKIYMRGEVAGENTLGFKPVKHDADEAMEHFNAVLEYLKWPSRPDPKTGVMELFQTDKKGRTVVIHPYQHALIALAAYEAILAYRDGEGVKKDEAKARAIAHDLVQTLAPLHIADLSWFLYNPLSAPTRARPTMQKYWDQVTYKEAKDYVEPELLAFAKSRLEQAKPAP